MNTRSRRDLILSAAVAGAALDLSRNPVIAAPPRVQRTPVALEQVRHSLIREQRSVLFRHVQEWMKEREAGTAKDDQYVAPFRRFFEGGATSNQCCGAVAGAGQK